MASHDRDVNESPDRGSPPLPRFETPSFEADLNHLRRGQTQAAEALCIEAAKRRREKWALLARSGRCPLFSELWSGLLSP
jgi:hypothetical protein